MRFGEKTILLKCQRNERKRPLNAPKVVFEEAIT